MAAADAKYSQWPAFDRSRKLTSGSPLAFGGSSVYTKPRRKCVTMRLAIWTGSARSPVSFQA